MAEVNLKIKVEAGKDFFHVFDKTGEYEKKNNEHGWNGPNDKLATVSNCVIRIYLPKKDDYTEVVVFPNLPRVDRVGFEIIPRDIFMESFPPGIYRFEYVVSFYDGRSIAESAFVFHTEPLCCCISKKKLKTNLFDPSSEEAQNVIIMETLLHNAMWASCAGDMESAQEICDLIWTKCGCCC